MAEVVGADVRLEAVRCARQRQTQHAGIVDQHVNALHRVGELSHAGQIGEIEVGYLDVARHGGRGLLRFRNGAAGNHDAVTSGGQCRGGRLADAAIAARDNDSHRAIMQCF